MSEYEFWNELGNIFNAVVAYQQKTIEFNKRFVNPWIRLGTVFDKEDRNAETVSAYKKAIEIDPQNAANWQALGDVYFKMGSFDDAAAAYSRTIDLNPGDGWAYTNLALTYATQQKYTEAINLYIKSLEFLADEKDRAVTWNRLGNAYRKVNDYENAFIAFQRADECDAENTGFNDQLDDAPAQVMVAVEGELPVVTEEIKLPESLAAQMSEEVVPVAVEGETATANIITNDPVMLVLDNPEDLISALKGALASSDGIVADEETTSEQQPVEETVVVEPLAEVAVPVETAPVVETVAVEEPVAVVDALPVVEPIAETEQIAAATAETESSVEGVVESVAEEVVAEALQPEVVAETLVTETSPAEKAEEVHAEVPTETTMTAVLLHTVETIADASSVNQPTVVVLETEAAPLDVNMEVAAPEQAPGQEAPAEVTVAETEVVESVAQEEVQAEASVSVEPVIEAESQPVVEVVAEVTSESSAAVEETAPVAEVPVEPQPILENPADVQSNESIIQEIIALTVDGKSGEAAYEEFLQDATQPELVQDEHARETAEPQEVVEPVAMKNEVRVELDTKNAHVWNELGNVYFNSGAYEEAITAYGKAIELDGWFAWPYSNLALAYVQKEKYAEAVLLYQRSIELFSSDKDKAVTWNRLGNVYRRLNDYENAIASYQRADELDPNNTTRSLRSSFSLLGSFNTEPSPSFAS